LVVRVYGEDYGVLRRQAERIRRGLAGIRGLPDPQVDLPAEQPTLEIEPKLAAARRYGLKPGDIRRAAGTVVNGLEVGSFFEQQKVFSVVVRGVPASGSSLTSIRNIPIDTPGGGQVRLGDVAGVRIAPNPVDIRHDAVSRYVDVRGGVGGRDLGSVTADVQHRLQRMSFPLAYHAELLGPSGETPGRFPRLAITAAVAIFLLLQAAFGSWRLATLAFVTTPAALVGGLLVVIAEGGEFSLGAAVGLLTVLGIASRNVVVLIVHLQRLRERSDATFDAALEQLVLRGARERFVPIATTAATIALALTPFAVAGDIAGNEVLHSTASVVLGGLITSTALNLFVVPAIYLHYGAGAPTRLALRARGRSAPATPRVHVNG
jgi:Cu/Ag efflux pump CusA